MLDNMQNTINSSEIIDRIEELEGCEELSQAEKDELITLKKIDKYAAGYSQDWEHGVTLIHEGHFLNCCREFCNDLGMLDEDTSPIITAHIDWDGVAHDMSADYTIIDFDGETYYIQ